MLDQAFTVLQIPADQLEVTPGRIAGGILVLSTLSGSVLMLSQWWKRTQNQQEWIPAAQRQPLFVPTLLLLFGLVLTTYMAAVSLSVSGEPAVPAANPTPADIEKIITRTLSYNATLLIIFGSVIFLAQQGRSRHLEVPETPSAPSAPDVVASQTFEDTDPPNTEPTSVSAHEAWNLTTELRYAVETFLVAYLPTVGLRLTVVSFQPDAPSHPFLKMLNEGVEVHLVVLIATMAVVVAPIVEELLFRVTVLGGLIGRHSANAGLVTSSVLFSLAHGFPDSIALLPLAFAIGYAYRQRRSYRTVALIHLLFNGFNLLVAGLSLV